MRPGARERRDRASAIGTSRARVAKPRAACGISPSISSGIVIDRADLGGGFSGLVCDDPCCSLDETTVGQAHLDDWIARGY
jgi:hypothetical protein